tara:strand:+ start:76 stop:1047 length:972 start_codon:yes stop_codon:yes gene_type:complete
MMENQSAEQQQEVMEEQLEIQVTEDPVEPQAQAGGDDELETYTKSVSKRINKLNAKAREAEQRAQQLEQIALQKEAELQQYRQYSQQQSNQVLVKEEEALVSKEAQIDDVYRKAVESGDADLITKAAKLQSDISIQKEKLRVAKARQQTATQEQETYVSQGNEQPVYQQPEQQVEEQEVQPTEDALAWHERNPWYANKDDEDDMKATQYAYYVHYNLANEGYDVGSDEYYEELDSRVGTVYPHTKSAQSGSQTVESESRPAVQRVASAPTGGRSKTQGKKNSVSFSKSELERLRGLKPHNMSEQAWLERVAKEKQKIAQREAS